ncbi:WD40 repeat domain-containing protein [Actinomycetospora sp. C-140]
MTEVSRSVRAEAADAPARPYIGLAPFAEADSVYFFGRRSEVSLLASNLRASRLTLMYAPSGVGKTSTLRAGLLPRLRKVAEAADLESLEDDDLSEAGRLIVYVSTWSGTPMETIASVLGEVVRERCARRRLAGPVERLTFSADGLQRACTIAEATGVDLIFDQFEEYLLYAPTHDPDNDLARELGAILRTRDVSANFLLSLREDAVAGLDRFKVAVPRLFDNYLRLAHLDESGARAAIEGPLDEFNRAAGVDGAMTVEPALVDDLLAEVRVGRLSVGPDDAAPGPRTAERHAIEAPFLQLVLTRIWDEERAEGSGRLRQSTLQRLGGAHSIVQNHLDTVMAGLSVAERDLAAAIFRSLVTSSGSKIALAVDDLADMTDVPRHEILELVEYLASGTHRVLRPVPPPAGDAGPTRYEIFHDVLGAAVLSWRRRHLAEVARAAAERKLVEDRRRAEADALETQQKLRRTQLIGLVVVIALLLAIGGGFIALLQAQKAERAALLSRAAQSGDVSPTVSLSDAVQADDVTSDVESQSAVLRAASLPRSEVVLGPGSRDNSRVQYLLNARSAPGVTTVGPAGEVRALTDDGRVVGRRTAPASSGVSTASDVSADGDRVATIDSAQQVSVLSMSTGAVTSFGPVSPNARVGFLSGPAEGRVVLVDGNRGVYVHRLDGQGPDLTLDTTATLAQPVGDGSVVVTSDATGEHVTSWNAMTGQKLAETAVPGLSWLLPFGRDRVVVISAGAKDTLGTWAWASPMAPATHTLEEYRRSISNVRVDEASNAVILAVDKTARVYDLTTGALVFDIPEQPDWVNDAAFSPDGQWVATAGGDGKVQIWERMRSYPRGATYSFAGHEGGVGALSWDQASRGLLSVGSTDGTVRDWILPDDHRFTGHSDWALAVDESGDGRWLVSGSSDTSVCVTAVNTEGPPAFPCLVTQYRVSDVHFDPTDARRLMVLTDFAAAPELYTWSPTGAVPGAPFQPITDVGGYLVSIAVSEDGRTVAAGDNRGVVHLWDAATGFLHPEASLRATAGPTVAGLASAGLTFDPRGQYLAAAGGDAITVWRQDTGRYLPAETLPLANAAQVTYDPTGTYIAGTTSDGTIELWTRDGRPVLDRPLVAEGSRRLGSPAFSSDGRLIAAGNASGLVQVWDVRSGRLVASERHHGEAVNDVAFLSPDGSTIASASDDRDVATWTCLACRDPQAAMDRARQVVNEQPAG